MSGELTFGATLRAHRVSSGLTQEELASTAGVSVRTLRGIEQGTVRLPRADTMRRLTRAVGMAGRLSTVEPTRIGVLGPLVVEQHGALAELGTGKRRSLLILLALHPGRLVSRDEIVDALWHKDPPGSYRKLVSGYAAGLRAGLEVGPPGPSVAMVGGGYRLTATPDQLDLLRFEDLAKRADAERAADLATALKLYASALDCWRGPLLAGEDAALRGLPVATGLARRRVHVLLEYADLAFQLDDHAGAEAALRLVLPDEPLHEGLHARLMTALSGIGQQAAALRVFGEIRQRLADELGVHPGAELRAAHERVLRQDSDPRTRRPRPAQLPPDISGFTGRAGYLRRLDVLLAEHDEPAMPIAAVVGTAGVGKTALAVRWAHRVRHLFPDGQLHADLRGYATDPPARPVAVLAQFLSALGVPAPRVPVEPAEASALYRTLLGDARVLVVLDNAGSADQVRPLLPGSPGCLVVVTSRDRLTGLVAHHGAHRLELDVLDRDESHTLLATLLGPDRVAAEPQAAAELARLCARLPLALRIVAADLASRPHRGIGERVTELAADPFADEDATAAVRGAFDLSYAALPDDARRLFRLLGVIPGQFATDALVAAMAEVPVETARRGLDRLAAAHLLAEVAPRRYTFHDLLREYAADRACAEDPADSAAARTRLHDWYLRWSGAAAERLYPGVTRIGDASAGASFDADEPALRWLDGERANLLAVIRDAADAGPRRVAWLLADTLRPYFWSGLRAVDWLQAAQDGARAAVEEGDEQAQAAMQLSLGNLFMRLRRYADALEYSENAVALSRRAKWLFGQSAAHQNLGNLRRRFGQPLAATEHYEHALRINASLGAIGAAAVNLSSLGHAHYELGRLATAADYQQRGLLAHRAAGTRHLRAVTISVLGRVEHDLGQLGEATEHLTEAVELNRESGNRAFEAEARATLAAVHLEVGRVGLALDEATAALELARHCDDPTVAAVALGAVAATRAHTGALTEALADYTEALRLANEHEDSWLELRLRIGLAGVHRRLGEVRPATRHAQLARSVARARGYRLIEAHALVTLAELGDRSAATEALELYRETGSPIGEARCRQLRDL